MQEIMWSGDLCLNAKNRQVVTFYHHGNNDRQVHDVVKQLQVGKVKAPTQFG